MGGTYKRRGRGGADNPGRSGRARGAADTGAMNRGAADPIGSGRARGAADTGGEERTDDAGFICRSCSARVSPEGAGSGHRNHCPKCLTSVHLDVGPGDRASPCGGVMDPISVWVKKNGEWALIHRCRECGALNANRTAADDNPALLMSVAVKPLASPPFPLSRLEEMLKI